MGFSFKTAPAAQAMCDEATARLIADMHAADRILPTACLLDILAMDLIDHGSLAIDKQTAGRLRQLMHAMSRTRIKEVLKIKLSPEGGPITTEVILEAIRSRIADIVEGRGAY